MNFTSTDIGSPLLTGTSKRAGADIEITAGGRDIWETRDGLASKKWTQSPGGAELVF
jgi:hypothetical protein